MIVILAIEIYIQIQICNRENGTGELENVKSRNVGTCFEFCQNTVDNTGFTMGFVTWEWVVWWLIVSALCSLGSVSLVAIDFNAVPQIADDL